MATTTLQIIGIPTLSADKLVEVKRALKRKVDGFSGAYADVAVIAAASLPVAPTTVAGTNGVLSTVLTWVKSTSADVTAQKIEFIADSDSSVLKTYYVAPGDVTGTFVATAVAQKAQVTAISPAGSTTSALSATFTPTAT